MGQIFSYLNPKSWRESRGSPNPGCKEQERKKCFCRQGPQCPFAFGYFHEKYTPTHQHHQNLDTVLIEPTPSEPRSNVLQLAQNGDGNGNDGDAVAISELIPAEPRSTVLKIESAGAVTCQIMSPDNAEFNDNRMCYCGKVPHPTNEEVAV